MGALYLNGDKLPANQTSLVYLCNRGRAQGHVIDGIEDLLDGPIVFPPQRLEQQVTVHWLHARAEFGELLAEALGQNLRTHGENLPRLHEGRTKLLEKMAKGLRRKAVKDVIAARYRQYLSEASHLARPRDLVPRGRRRLPSKEPDRLLPRIGMVSIHLHVPVTRSAPLTLFFGYAPGHVGHEALPTCPRRHPQRPWPRHP